jgi:hypothetical protein
MTTLNQHIDADASAAIAAKIKANTHCPDLHGPAFAKTHTGPVSNVYTVTIGVRKDVTVKYNVVDGCVEIIESAPVAETS